MSATTTIATPTTTTAASLLRCLHDIELTLCLHYLPICDIIRVGVTCHRFRILLSQPPNRMEIRITGRHITAEVAVILTSRSPLHSITSRVHWHKDYIAITVQVIVLLPLLLLLLLLLLLPIILLFIFNFVRILFLSASSDPSTSFHSCQFCKQ